ncbi:hypothetical protein [Reyranella sp. CPCC 100927]|nr:hypothetical protein [Reyranella sp. CPCC 100927]
MVAPFLTATADKKKETNKVTKRKLRRRAWVEMARAFLIGQKKT